MCEGSIGRPLLGCTDGKSLICMLLGIVDGPIPEELIELEDEEGMKLVGNRIVVGGPPPRGDKVEVAPGPPLITKRSMSEPVWFMLLFG